MKLFSRGITSVAPMEYLPCQPDAALSPGMALKLSDGQAALCAGGEKPLFICVGRPIKDGSVQAMRVLDDMIFDAELSAAGDALKVGDKVTIDADGIRVSATTADGVAEICAFTSAGRAAGETVRVRF